MWKYICSLISASQSSVAHFLPSKSFCHPAHKIKQASWGELYHFTQTHNSGTQKTFLSLDIFDVGLLDLKTRIFLSELLLLLFIIFNFHSTSQRLACSSVLSNNSGTHVSVKMWWGWQRDRALILDIFQGFLVGAGWQNFFSM